MMAVKTVILNACSRCGYPGLEPISSGGKILKVVHFGHVET